MLLARYGAPAHRRSPWLRLAVAAVLAVSFGCSSEPHPRPDTRLGPLGELLPVSERIDLGNLDAPVDLVRDLHGRIHIYASSWPDAYRAQGYLVARDRTLQLELLRRNAQGRLADLLGHLDPGLIEADIAMRHVGLARVAEQQYASLSGEPKELLDAYADGVSQLFKRIRSGEQPLPPPLSDGPVPVVAPGKFTDWSGVDSLAVGRLQAWALSYGAAEDIELQGLLDAMKSSFAPDHTDPQRQRRVGLERDLLRFAPADPATIIAGPGAIGGGGGMDHRLRAARAGDRNSALDGQRPPALPSAGYAARSPVSASLARRHPAGERLLSGALGYVRAVRRARALWGPRQGATGSNSWAISPELSATGNALLANDPHLALSAPSVFWPVSLHVSFEPGGVSDGDLHVAGVALPGIPGVVLGHNERIAWGATTALHDVTDVYAETLTADGTAVLFEGKEVPLQTIEEVIEVHQGAPVTYTVHVVPHHGPIVPTIVDGQVMPLDPAQGALSVRWTGMEPTTEMAALIGLSRARDVDEAQRALQSWGAGAQNWMLADRSGNILWTSHAVVPIRDERALQWNPATYEGLLPCLVLPGDGTAEWIGAWDSDRVPWAKNPQAGFLATANNDPLGGTLDNDPSDDRLFDGSSAYLGCSFAMGYRQGRIHSLIQNHPLPMSPPDLAAIQSDRRSSLGAALVPSLLLAIDNAREEHRDPGSHPHISAVVNQDDYAAVDETMGLVRDSLALWRDVADYDAPSGVNPVDNAPWGAEVPEAWASQATLLFNAWLVRFVALSFGDELAQLGLTRPSPYDVRALLHLMSVDPATLATYDPVTQDSALFDDMGTADFREGRQDRMIHGMIEALRWLAAELGPDIGSYRWGALHTVRFEAMVPDILGLSIPPKLDPVFADGFPRHGDSFAIDACQFPLRRGLDEDLLFSYTAGPAQRFVVDLDPAGLQARNVLPGGAVSDPSSGHFADQAELWRRNEAHDVPFDLDDVLAAHEARLVATPSRFP